MRRTRFLVLAVVVMACFAVAGCGGGGGATSVGTSANLTPPTQPTAQDCRPDVLHTNVKLQNTPPTPGRYSYTVKGTRRDLSRSGVPVTLPSTAPLIVSSTTHTGNVVCFRTQIAYTPKQANTVTFALRGGDFYIVSIDFYVAGQTLRLRPNPPIKAVDGSGTLDWGGTFGGPTTGSFAGSQLGRKSFTFKGRRDRAIGVQLRFSLSGELRGSNVQTLWLSLTRGTLYQQKVQQVQNFGSQPVELRYTANLKSAP
jgi:hypothetical protein